MRMRLEWFGEKLAQRLADMEAGRLAPVTPRDAATVVVLRPAAPDGSAGRMSDILPFPSGMPPGARGPGAEGGESSPHGKPVPPGENRGVEVLMLRRTAAMKFAPGAYVFPGGSVDLADSGAELAWEGPDPAEFGARLGASAELARALVCAAVRETFEESGILLAAPPGGGPLAVPSGPSWEADRAALASGAVSLSGLLARRGLVLRADLLVPWARWITPAGESRRFDARFFAAALPADQVVTGHEAESDHVAWLRPADALEAARAGQISLMPPTATTLNDFAVAVAGGEGLADILARRPAIKPVQPRLVLDNGVAWLVIPDEVGYPLEAGGTRREH